MKITTFENEHIAAKAKLNKIAFIIILLLAGLNFSCSENSNLVSPEFSSETIEASGIPVTETIDIDEFNSLHIATAGKVNIQPGPEQKVVLTLDDNLWTYINLKVENGKLFISKEPNVNLVHMNLTVDITLTDLAELRTSSAGDISGTMPFACDDLKLIASSAGNISLEFQAAKLSTEVSSAGNMYLSGTAASHHSILSSAGDLQAFDLITEKTNITVNSLGDAQIFVTQSLDANLSSLGSVYYKGQPEINVSASNTGRLIDCTDERSHSPD